MSDEQVRWIALFFLFSSMDEKVAIQSAQKAIAQLKSAGAKMITPALIIRTSRKILEHYHQSPMRNRAPVIPQGVWTLPPHFDMTSWMKFQKDAAPEQVVAVIFSKILGFNDVDIAEGLGISLGTARYRVGKGIRQLGTLMKISGSSNV